MSSPAFVIAPLRSCYGLWTPAQLLASSHFNNPCSLSRPNFSFLHRRPLLCQRAWLNSTVMTTASTTLHDITVNDIDGAPLSLSTMKDRVVLAVNVASDCGYTASGYAKMKTLAEKYGDKGLVVLAAPCNQFGGQEPGSAKEIKEFAMKRCEQMVVLEKMDVNGEKRNPIFKVGMTKFPGDCAWNFDCAFLYDKEGKPVARFGNKDSADIIGNAVEKLL